MFGIDQFGESAMIVKARIKTRPIRQWAIGREFNGRMRKRFEELGIEMQFPQRNVVLDVKNRSEAPPLDVLVDSVAADTAAHLVPEPLRETALARSGDDADRPEKGGLSTSSSSIERPVADPPKPPADGTAGRTRAGG